MTGIVLDASTVLAVLLQEPGAERAQACLSGALCTTVNLAEIMAACADKGLSLAFPDALMTGYSVRYVDFDKDLALTAALLHPATRHRGLSLGDRACLALAIRENATAITTDRAWADLDVGCHIEVIR